MLDGLAHFVRGLGAKGIRVGGGLIATLGDERIGAGANGGLTLTQSLGLGDDGFIANTNAGSLAGIDARTGIGCRLLSDLRCAGFSRKDMGDGLLGHIDWRLLSGNLPDRCRKDDRRLALRQSPKYLTLYFTTNAH